MIVALASGALSLIAGVQGAPALLVALIPASTLLVLGILLLFAGAGLLSILRFHRNARCEKCKAIYAMKEASEGTVFELATSEGTRRTTVRTYRCGACTNEKVTKTTEIVEKTSS